MERRRLALITIPDRQRSSSAAQLPLRASRLNHQIVLFRKAGGSDRGGPIVLDGFLEIAKHLEQMTAHGIEPIMIAQAFVAVQSPETLQSARWPVRHRGGDGVVEHYHGIVRNALKQIVQRQDLRPIRIFRARRFVMNGAIAACNWYGPTDPFESARVSSATPSAISSRSQSLRSCLRERNELTVGALRACAAHRSAA